MPFQNSDLGLTTEFQLGTGLGKFLETDITNWAGAGINVNDVVIWFVMVGPDGITFHTGSAGGPDIDPAGGTNNLIDIPLDSSGAYQEGSYTITMYAEVTGGVDQGTYQKSFPITFSDDRPTVVLDWTVSCFCTPLISVEDQTAVGNWTLVSQSFSLVPPSDSAAPYNVAYVSATTIVTSGSDPVYSGTWGIQLEKDITRTYSTHAVTATLTQRDDEGCSITGATFDVVCIQDTCAVKCCIRSAYNRWQGYITSGNTGRAESAHAVWLDMIGLLGQMVYEVKECGDTSKTSAYSAKILAIGNCQDGCGDCGGESSGLIEPLCIGGVGTTYAFSAIQGLVVNVTPGSPTAVQYKISDTAWEIITGVYNTIASSSGGITSTLLTWAPSVTAGAPDQHNYVITWAGPNPVRPEMYLGRLKITFAGAVPTVVMEQEDIMGTPKFKTPTITAVGSGNGANPAVIEISDFFAAAGGNRNFIPTVQIIHEVPKFILAGDDDMANELLKVSIFKIDATLNAETFRIKFSQSAGAKYTWNSLSNIATGYSEIQTSFEIKA